MLDRLLDAVRAGESRTLVVRGEPGTGKTALLDYLAGRASGCRVARAAGVQSEMELAFAALQLLCAPMLDRLERLPVPQRDALRIAFGLSPGPAPDRFLVGLAVLSLLSDAAEDKPLICLVDDQQWLDRVSAQVLAFAARRLDAESVGLVFAARVPSDDLAGLPELVVEGLRAGDAGLLLDSVLTGPLDPQVRDRIIAETRGNPLALLELPRGLTPAEVAGGFGLPGASPLPGRVEESFRRRLAALPPGTRRLLQLAAADPVGDPVLLWQAAGRLGIGAEAAIPAAEAGLVEFGARVVFRHPLVRSAAYRSASVQERRDVHHALAEVTEPKVDPDRRAWHRAQAAPGPDEDVAGELERSAGRAQVRGGLAAAAAFLERSAMLTPEPGRRAQRLLDAARAERDAGALDAALGLLVAVEARPLDPPQATEVQLLRGQIAWMQRRVGDAAEMLLSAARRLDPFDAGLARETHLEALGPAMWAGDLGRPGGLREAAEAARAAPPGPEPPRAVDVMLDAFAVRLTDGHAAAAPLLRRALELFLTLDAGTGEAGRWSWLAGSRASSVIALELWDAESWHALARLGGTVSLASYASSVLYNGLGRHDAARDAAWRAFEQDQMGYGAFVVTELAEAASRTGDADVVKTALQWLSERTRVTPTQWALGIEARVRALLSDGDAAERLYRESIDRLGRTRLRPELARAHLLYGEWLRRERRRADAREELRIALGMLETMGIGAFAERARRELAATGETARKRSVETTSELTAQEARIARLARDGLSNPEIGARMFISARTVQYHLRKVFTKLDISSRGQLDRVPPAGPDPGGPL